jgi:signal transduction histidine kinase
MKKLRLVIRIATGVLASLSIIGIIILIANDKLDLLDTSYEIIAFSMGSAGMLLAVFGQVDSYQQEKINNRIMAKLEEIKNDNLEDDKTDQRTKDELAELLSYDQKIYKKLTKTDQQRSK